jgi:UDP-4-amino-4,6-dideoxy-N-acetyl-beta-L-altrosamine N-acetyltransferase
MILKGKKVSLKLIQKEDIELIRKWRNSKDVSKYFIFRGYISKEQQKKWFEMVSTSGRDFFFLIIVDGEPIGLTEIKNIDWDRREGETGIFIAKDEYKNALVSFEASYLIGRHFFETLNLQKAKIEIVESNKRALRYNKGLGFKEFGQREETIDGEICKVVLLSIDQNEYNKLAKERERLLKLLSYN